MLTAYTPFPWALYSKKLALRIEHPKYAGFFTSEEALSKQMRLVTAHEGSLQEGNCATLFLLIDESDGIIADAKYQLFGNTALIGSLEATCEILVRKNYRQAGRISADLLDKQMRDEADKEAFPFESAPFLNFALTLIENATSQCSDLPAIEEYTSSPLDFSAPSTESYSHWPHWKELSTKAKLAIIEEVINRDIRPYIELDAGGVQIIDFIKDREVIIAYQGSCTSCISATGSTLNAIQQILQTKIDPELVVTPDLSHLKLYPSGL